MIYFLPILILVILFSWAAWKNTKHIQNQRRETQLGLKQLSATRQLLEHLPQHRGSANALLNGDTSFQNKVVELQNSIQHDIDNINTSLNSHANNPALQDRWAHIQSNWYSLRKTLNSLSPAASFEHHTSLIAELIYLIQDICDRSQLSNNSKHKASATLCFHQLPNVIELCGQARGIGTGVAAQGHTTTATHIKLSFLQQHLHTSLEKINQHLQHKHHDIDSQLITQCCNKTQHFLDTLDKKILTPDKIDLKASDFFDQGSAAIAANLTIIDSFISRNR